MEQQDQTPSPEQSLEATMSRVAASPQHSPERAGQDYLTARLQNSAQVGEGTSIPPPVRGFGRVPLVSGVSVKKVVAGTASSDFVIGWIAPSTPNISTPISTYNIYSRNIYQGSPSYNFLGSAAASPFVARVFGLNNADPIGFFVQTELTNGLRSDIGRSPSTASAASVIPQQAAARILAAVQVIPNSVSTALSFDNDVYNPAGIHSTAVNPTRFTVSLAGFYLLNAQVAFATSAVGNLRQIRSKLNGTTFLSTTNITPVTGFGSVLETTKLTFLNAGDYIEFYVFQDSGGNLNATNTGDTFGAISKQN